MKNSLFTRKSGIILLLFSVINVIVYAQEPSQNVIITDYEGNSAVTNVYNNINMPGDITVDNPYKTGINTSAKCTKLTVTAAWNEVGFLNFKNPVDLSLYSGVAYKIYAGASATTHLKVVKNTNTNWWENPDNTIAEVKSSIVPKPNVWVADTIRFFASGSGLTYGFALQPQVNGVYYIDDVVLIGKKPVAARVGLKDYASAKGKNIGLAVPMQTFTLDNSRADVQLINQEFNYSIADNDNKFWAIEPQKGVFNFTRLDVFVDKSLAAGRQVRGMGYVWHEGNPDWLLNGNFSRTEMLQIMKNHITTSMKRYKGRINEWEIVNEAITSPGQEGSNVPQLRKSSLWYKAIGPDYIDSAFVFAHRADPEAKLYYNDYGAEVWNQKADTTFNIIKRMKARGIPIHGIGLQAHLGGSSYTPQAILDGMDKCVKRWNSIGMEVSVTELDYGLTTTTAADLLKQAQVFRAVAKVWLDNSNFKTLIFWGLIDRESWLVLPEYGGKKMPLLFDDNLQPKLCYSGIADLLKGDQTLNDSIENLTLKVNSTVSISLNWTAPKLKYGIRNYIIYMNGDSLKKTTDINTKITGLKPNTSYTFVVRATDDLGVVAAESQPITGVTMALTAIGDHSVAEELAIYPNPVGHGELLKIEWKENEPASLYVFDINGKKVFSGRIDSEFYTLPDLGNKGLYMINIRSKNTNLSRKVVFQ